MSGFSGTRRDVLRRGAAAVGAAAIAGNAGCMGLLGGGGGSYTNWLPEPGATGDEDHYQFTTLNLQSLAEHEGELDDADTNFEDFEETWAPVDVDWEDVSMFVQFDNISVVEAAFDSDEVVADLEDEDFDEEAEYEGYTLMLGPREARMMAVGDDTLVMGTVREDPEDVIQTVIDTENGDEDRYLDDSKHFGELADELGAGDVVSGFTSEPTEESAPERGRFENQVAEGHRLQIEDGETKGKWVLVFDETDDVNVDDVEDWVEASQDEADGEFANWEGVEVTKSGRAAVIEGTAAVEEMALDGNADRMGTAGGGNYARWLPKPRTIGDSDHYRFTKLNLQAFAEHEDEFDASANFEGFEETWAPADVDWEDVPMLLRFNGISVLEADFETESVVADFEDEDFDEEAEYEGYTLLFGPEGKSMAAIDDGTLVLAGTGFRRVDEPQDAIEAVIDTENGEQDRYEDDSEDFSELADDLGDADLVFGGGTEPTEETNAERGQFENQVAEGETLKVNGEATDGTWVLVFESEDDVDTGDVEDWVDATQDEDGGEFEDWNDVEVEANGRMVVVEATTDTDKI